MKDERKVKAAIMAVIHMLEEEREEESPQENTWALSGRKIIMENNIMVQTRSVNLLRRGW